MEPRLSLVLALLLLAPLGGCLGDDAASDTPIEDAGVNVTDDGPVTDNLTATSPTDLTGGGKAHIHDYWDGATRVLLYGGQLDVQVLSEVTFMNLFVRGDPALGGTRFELPDGKTVYEGTGRMEITVGWADPTITNLAIGLKPPTEIEVRQTYQELEPLENGGILVWDVAPEETDMPHEQVSRWGFLFAAEGAGNVAEGTIDLKIEIVKMRDVELFPAHPDFYEDTDHYVLADKEFTYQQATPVNLLREAALGEKRSVLELDRGVPMETRVLTIDITVDEGAGTAAVFEAGGMELLYRGADSVRYRTVPYAVDGSVFRFALPIVDAQTDSPYTDVSVWRIGPVMKQAAPVPVGDDEGFTCFACPGTDVSGHALVQAWAEAPEGVTVPEPERLN